ncbi:hypothetical protein HY643_02955 [Candidatus Woesearchaeota archaeon]|nr:hypothetical protein [Candidatus Woesearchaeota archaeon]
MGKMKIRIEDKEGKVIFEGDYEYLEGGPEDKKQPSFFITMHSKDFKESYEILFTCENKEEVKELILTPLNKWVSKR